MHSAPTVNYPAGRSRFQIVFLGLIWLTSVLFVGFWLMQLAVWGWRQSLVVLVVLLCGIGAVSACYANKPATLRWDGQAWWSEAANSSHRGSLSQHLDFQACILICFHSSTGARQWHWIERRSAPQRWADFRRAVVATAGKPESQDNDDSF
ncbi:MAG: hypothetical protein WBI20_14375 [Burkholderiaceae bacterium]